jgi:dihydrofolate reductase
MHLSLIAALDRNFAIGRGNALPWHLPDDLKRFKALTLGKPVLMGRKTAESLGRALPGRMNLVLSRGGAAPFPGMRMVASIADAIADASGHWDCNDKRNAENAGELCVIGGGEIYALALPLATHMYLTHVDTAVDDCDAFFPAFDPADWRTVAREPRPADAKHGFAFEFVDYVRVGLGE